MKKGSILIIVSVLLTAMLCLAGCASDITYTDEETGVTVSLPDSWEEYSDSEKDDCFLAFTYEGSQDGSYEMIDCFLVDGFPYKSITDCPEDFFRHSSSADVEVDDVEEKELSSGTYYKVTASSGGVYYVDYCTVENNYLIRFMYVTVSQETPHLSDFEDMVDSAKYK